MNEVANKLLVEAALLIQQSDELAATDFEAAYTKGSAALQNIEEILAKHSGSNVAVELVLGRAPFSLQTIDQLKAKLATYQSIIQVVASPKTFLLFIGN